MGVAVLGSYARGDATPSSDLDLHAILREPPRIAYRTWFVDGLHVSFGFAELAALRRVLARPGDWSLKLPSTVPAAWAWAGDEAREALGDPPDLSRPAGEPELEDFVEWCAKAQRAADGLGLRLAARGLADEAPALLLELNEVPVVGSKAEAVRAACAFPVAPEGWPDDLPVLLGVVAATDARVRAAVERVGSGILRLLRERRSRVGDGQPELTRYLHDGTLERHLGFAA